MGLEHTDTVIVIMGLGVGHNVTMGLGHTDVTDNGP